MLRSGVAIVQSVCRVFNKDTGELKYGLTVQEQTIALVKREVLTHDWKIGELIDHDSNSKRTASVPRRHSDQL
jgi:hypothetical protein